MLDINISHLIFEKYRYIALYQSNEILFIFIQFIKISLIEFFENCIPTTK